MSTQPSPGTGDVLAPSPYPVVLYEEAGAWDVTGTTFDREGAVAALRRGDVVKVAAHHGGRAFSARVLPRCQKIEISDHQTASVSQALTMAIVLNAAAALLDQAFRPDL